MLNLRLFLGALYASIAAFELSVGVGIPAWRNFTFGDATDIAMLVFLAVVFLYSKPKE